MNIKDNVTGSLKQGFIVPYTFNVHNHIYDTYAA